MKKQIFILSLIIWCLSSALVCANVPLMPVEDIVPGMRGIAKTVIEGDTIEEFNIEVLGVIGNDAMGHNILIKASGDVIDRSGGIAQGMSGSPVYINGRLAGAVAFGKAFTDPKYCFLTPIGRMLDLLNEPAPRPSEFLPKNTPLMAGGFTESGVRYLSEKLDPFGLKATGVGGSGSFSSTQPLQPGSAVGVSLMRGDIQLGALGTVTWVGDDGEILAFGHPFMQRGDSCYFMNKAWILASLPNLESAYKVGNIGETIGTITQDRSAGIAGKIGQGPPVVPVYVSVTDGARGINNSSRVEVIDDEVLLPAMLDAVAYNTVAKTMDREGGGTARFSFRIDGRGDISGPINVQRENMYYAAAGIGKLINQELVEAGTILTQNKFEKVDIYGVNINIVLDDKAEVAEIISAAVREKEAAPGDTVHIDVQLQPYRAPKVTKTVLFKIPKEQREGKLPLTVRGGSSLAWIQNLLRKQREEGVPAQQKDNRKTLNDFIKSINEADQNNDLIVDIAAGQGAPNAAMQSGGGFASMLEGSPMKQKTTMNFIVDGTTDIVIDVVK